MLMFFIVGGKKNILPRFGVDVFDPLSQMKFIRRVELLHSKEDLEKQGLSLHWGPRKASLTDNYVLSSILFSCLRLDSAEALSPVIALSSLRECGFYTNGSKLIVLTPGSMIKDKKNKQAPAKMSTQCMMMTLNRVPSAL